MFTYIKVYGIFLIIYKLDIMEVKDMTCPKCGSENVIIQREQTATIGAGTNKVVIQELKKTRGCLYWVTGGWIFTMIYWITIGWWWNLLFGRKKKGGLNLHANKSINRTMATCQECGHSWKV